MLEQSVTVASAEHAVTQASHQETSTVTSDAAQA